ncbi:MAG: hypothetical protein OXU63_10640 [Acidobacteriota bacterium]|nr:hypothetical protein [Acidobacteriota bacterium]
MTTEARTTRTLIEVMLPLDADRPGVGAREVDSARPSLDASSAMGAAEAA